MQWLSSFLAVSLQHVDVGSAIAPCITIVVNLCKGINVIIQADAVWLQIQGKRAKIAVKISMYKAVVKPDSIKL